MGAKGMRYKLWWSGNIDGTGDVGVLVKEGLCEKVVEMRRKSESDDSSKEEVVRSMCA